MLFSCIKRWLLFTLSILLPFPLPSKPTVEMPALNHQAAAGIHQPSVPVQQRCKAVSKFWQDWTENRDSQHPEIKTKKKA